MGNEVLKAVNSRVLKAVELIDSGRAIKARNLLKAIGLLLPAPEERHIKATNASLREVSKQ